MMFSFSVRFWHLWRDREQVAGLGCSGSSRRAGDKAGGRAGSRAGGQAMKREEGADIASGRAS